MTAVSDDQLSLIGEFADVADHFAARAQIEETCRDRARPGTGVHHLHAHSATLWRLAESSLRARLQDLAVDSASQ